MSLLMACGVKKESAAGGGAYTVTSEGTPFTYELSQNICTFEELTMNPKVPYFANGVFNVGQIKDLRGKSLDESVILGGEYKIKIGRVSTLESINTGTPFEYCISKLALIDGSLYKNAALSVLYPLRDFENKYKSLIKHLDIPKVKIQILPKYSRIETKQVKRDKVTTTKYLINNAMYLGSKDTLIFLPQGNYKNYSIPFGGVPLWKSPAVVMHEYGHHLFKHLVIQNNDMNSLGDTGLCMDTRDLSIVTATNIKSERAEVTKEDMLVALNEGFADIFAFYASGKKTFFKKMGCMEDSRDVQKSLFFSKSQKVLSETILNNFLDNKVNASVSCTTGVNYQDPHMLGAIIAHGLYKTLESTNLSGHSKLEIILSWARELRSAYINSNSPQDLLKTSIEAFFDKATKYLPSSEKYCEITTSVFPIVDMNCR